MQYIRICSWCPLIRDGDGGVWWCVLLAVSNDMNKYNLSHILCMCVCMICICCDNFKLYFFADHQKIGAFTKTMVEEAYTKIIDGSLICPRNLFCMGTQFGTFQIMILFWKFIWIVYEGLNNFVVKLYKGMHDLHSFIVHRLYFMYS